MTALARGVWASGTRIEFRLSVAGIAIAALVANVTTMGHKGAGETEIRRAVLAPFAAVEMRRASALCGDFTAGAVSRLAVSYSHSSSCAARVQVAFDLTTSAAPLQVRGVREREIVRGIRLNGRHAAAEISVHGVPSAVRTVSLVKVRTRWLVSTPPVLVVITMCHRQVATRKCDRVVALSIAQSVSRAVSR